MNKGKAPINVKVRIRKDQIKKNGKSVIYLQCHIYGTLVKILTGVEAKLSDFDEIKQKIKGKSQEAYDGNLIINGLLSKIHQIDVEVKLGKLTITADYFRARVSLDYSTKDFLEYFEWRLNRRFKIAESTFIKERNTLRLLKVWQPNGIQFRNIDTYLIDRFYKFLLVERKNNPASIHKNFKILKFYLRSALEDGCHFNFPEKSFNGLSKGNGNIEYLEAEYLKRAISLFESKILRSQDQKGLRVFLFSCFTGLRYSDVQNLTNSNFKKDRLIFIAQKTKKKGEKLELPLSRMALKFCNPKEEKPLGLVPSNQKINQSLKIIGKRIDSPISLTFHKARHTFATQFLESGGRLEVLKEILGHSKIDQTMVYVHVNFQNKTIDLNRFGEFFDDLLY